ncbi:hypothetical protein HMP09_0529 [Sphingomonas sp. HMP9]|uniref:hypothetical protein n=1 Tax=Sphingomonas sp. HMP9 TaxID=1517554 RepID=UPI001596B915|nr:hypothetical protein [Sphingomonas sp. HMP9]BCA61295.1 hypothetical protein HMP09_0529 [Sphingomonas sp. HMP9]
MVPLGIAGTMVSIARGSAPASFPPGFLLTINTLAMLGFGGLTYAAIRRRKELAWHQLLMLSGTVIVLVACWTCYLCETLPRSLYSELW